MKKTLAFVGACALTLAASQSASAKKPKDSEQPKHDLQAECEAEAAGNQGIPLTGACKVLRTLSCIESEDLACTVAGYAEGFVKLHNGVDTNTVLNAEIWGGTFLVTDISLEPSRVEKDGGHRVRLTYVETVVISPSVVGIPLPDATFIQHEDVVVTFNNDGQMTLWDQTGDVAEQDAVTNYLAAVFGI